MAFKTLKTRRRAVTLEALGAAVERRRAAVGDVQVPRNPGTNRTSSKRALLKAVKDAGGEWYAALRPRLSASPFSYTAQTR